jgi:hypothetical protein
LRERTGNLERKSGDSKVNSKKGLLLDIGCRDRKEPNWVGIDSISRPGVDIVHDLESFPYPIQDGACITIKAA